MNSRALKAAVLAAGVLVACDPVTTVRGRVVRAPQAEGVADAVVNVRCEGLNPEEGLTAKTDANGRFHVSTIGGRLPDSCTLHVNDGAAPPVSTTLGAAKAKDDDPENRMRTVEVTLPAK